jgi:hypothetical protein
MVAASQTKDIDLMDQTSHEREIYPLFTRVKVTLNSTSRENVVTILLSFGSALPDT